MLTVDYDRLGLRAGRPPARPRLRRRPPRVRGAAPRRAGRRARLRRRRAARTCAALFGAMGDAGEARPTASARLRQRRRHPTCRSPTARSTASSPREVLEHIPDDARRARRARPRAASPAARIAVTVPAWLPEQVCWALTDEYHAPFVEGGHVRIYTEPELRRQMRARRPRARRRPPRPRPALALLVAQVRGRPHQRRPPARSRPTTRLLRVGHHRARPARHARWPTERCSTRCSARASSSTPRKPVGATRRPASLAAERPPSRLPIRIAAADGVVTADRVERDRRPSPSGSCPTGMIPWFPGGHADPWNHVEAAMALASAAGAPRPSGPTSGCVDVQRPDGAWHQYYLADRVEQDKLDANVVRLRRRRRVAPLAAVRRPRLRRGHVADRRARHRLRARPADRPAARSCGPATPTARRGRSPCSPARRASATACAAPSPSPSCSATSGPTGSCRRARLAHVIATTSPTPSPRSTAGPWTGTTRCSPACCSATPAGARSTPAATPSSWRARACAACPTGRGSPWPRPASACWPTSPSASASGPPTLFAWAQQYRGRRRPLLDRHRLPRRGPLPRRRAVHLHRRRRSCWPPTRCGAHHGGLGALRRPRVGAAASGARPPRRRGRLGRRARLTFLTTNAAVRGVRPLSLSPVTDAAPSRTGSVPRARAPGCPPAASPASPKRSPPPGAPTSCSPGPAKPSPKRVASTTPRSARCTSACKTSERQTRRRTRSEPTARSSTKRPDSSAGR